MRKLYSWIICLVICIGLNVSLEAQTLINYQQQKQKEIAERQRVEKQRYESACEKGTLEAFQEYIKLYPNGKYAVDVRNRIEDYNLWSTAVKTNTIEAYNHYIATSKSKSFKNDANEAITELRSIEEWKSIKASKSITEIELFIKTYPKSSCITNAQKRIHELKGENFYLSNDLLNAYQEFNKAGGKYALGKDNQSKFDECQEYWEYKNLTSYSSEEKLLAFLGKYPSGRYSDEVSNKVAISKAKSFTMYSGNYSLNEALGFAKDETTRSIVKRHYEAKQKEYSQYKKAQRRIKRQRNGGIINFGIEFMDLAFNPSMYSDMDNDVDYVMYYNVGLGIRLGNYKSPVQFEIGAKPGLVVYTLWYGSEDETKTSFHLPLYARLKIGLWGGTSSKWYVDGIGYYNAVKKSFLESDYSVSAGLGVSWRHWDWRIIYYKQDIDAQHTYQNYNFLGTSFSYYF
ncbi:hypothetical protein [Bacteroides caecicola]|uniref:hypothetical protein n=1 Tax=Bacteroides caecicola TaxID=1462569 RepID=UPI0020123BB2|nr:hypothetical protein [Bacteroides caecicola]MCL1625846.1 hypothetical protein [Bacteroides caecicola]